jgi:hypothetical protein
MGKRSGQRCGENLYQAKPAKCSGGSMTSRDVLNDTAATNFQYTFHEDFITKLLREGMTSLSMLQR